jgi:transcriptional regulator with XRE-family HTH domain
MAEIRRVDFKKVDRLRLDLGLNKQAFCRLARVCESTYSKLATSKKITDDVVIRVANALQVKPSALIFWEEETGALHLKSHDPGKTKKIGLVGAKTKISNTKPALVKVKA